MSKLLTAELAIEQYDFALRDWEVEWGQHFCQALATVLSPPSIAGVAIPRDFYQFLDMDRQEQFFWVESPGSVRQLLFDSLIIGGFRSTKFALRFPGAFSGPFRFNLRQRLLKNLKDVGLNQSKPRAWWVARRGREKDRLYRRV